MTLQNFAKELNPYVLDIARSIMNDRAYKGFSIEGDVMRMTIRSVYDYHPEAVVDDQGTILHTSCECHYDKGPVCPHVAALLMVASDHEQAPGHDLKTMLSRQDKDELVDIIMALVKTNPAAAFSVRMLAGDNEERRAAAKAAINTSFEAYLESDVHTSDPDHPALDGLYQVLDAAEDTNDPKVTFDLVMTAIEESVSFEQTILVINIPEETRNEMFLALEEVVSKNTESGVDVPSYAFSRLHGLIRGREGHIRAMFGSRILSVLVRLAGDSDVPDLDDTLKVFENLSRKTEDYDITDREELVYARYLFLEKFADDDDREMFLEGHPNNAPIRHEAIRKALDEGNNEEALKLSEVTRDLIFGGDWNPIDFDILLLEALFKNGKDYEAITYMRQMILDGDEGFYDVYIGMFEGYEREVEITEILDRLKSSEETIRAFLHIALIEERHDDVMEHIERDPRDVRWLHPYLPVSYHDRIDSCFYEAVLDMADEAANYEDLDDLIELLHVYKSFDRTSFLKAIKDIDRNHPGKMKLFDPKAMRELMT
jgi:hypothetical protein